MLRVLLLAAGFLTITIALLMLQPYAAPRQIPADLPAPDTAISRNLSTPLTELEEPDAPEQTPAPEVALAPEPAPAPLDRATLDAAVARAIADAAAPALETAPQAHSSQAGTPTPATTQEDDIREMTWNALRAIDTATGKRAAPGAPGSLLHTIVARSLQDTAPQANPAQDGYLAALLSEAGHARPLPGTVPAARTYKVRPGDSLQMIAQRLYGDSAAFEAIFAANRQLLGSPDDLRPGQVLALPAP